MDEDKKIIPEGEEKEIKAPGENSEELNEELENLRDTFQKTLDETRKEQAQEPVIQELDEGEEEEEAENEEASEEEETSEAKPEKKKKKKKTGAVIGALIAVIIIAPLLAFFVLSVTNPSFSAFVSTYTKAASAEKYEDKVKYYEEALKSCSGDSRLEQAMSRVIMEELIVETYKEKDYISAYSLMSQIMSEEQMKNPGSGEFKKFMKVKKQVEELSLKAFPQIIENVGDSTELPAEGILLAGLDVPENITENFKKAAKSFAEGYIFDKAAEDINDYIVAVNYYAEAYSALCSIGAVPMALAEKISTTLYKNGFITEAVSFSHLAIKGDVKSTDKEYLAMTEEIKACADFGGSVYDIAVNAIENEKTALEDIEAAVAGISTLSEKLNGAISDIAFYTVSAIKAEKENNLTVAAKTYKTVSSVLESFGMTDINIEYKVFEVLFNSGLLPEAQEISKELMTEENKALLTEEQTAFLENANLTFDALTKTSEIFGTYMNDLYQSGKLIDFEKVSAELDALITEESNKYDKAFVSYCKYFAALYAEGNEKGEKYDALDYALEIKELIPEQPFIYGSLLLDEYMKQKNFSKAQDTANLMLSLNLADEYANAALALSYRAEGDTDLALEAALRGIELSGNKAGKCGREAAVSYMLKGDFENAYPYLSSVYSASMSIDSCDLMLIFNKLYEGTNEEIKSELKEITAEIESTYKQYQVESTKDTKAILDGSKTLEDIFLSGDYDIVGEE